MSDDGGGIPYYLMPVAAVLGSYALFGGLRALYLIYANVASKEKEYQTPLSSRYFATLVVTVISSMFGYAYIVAQVNTAMRQNEYAHFDPLDILGLDESSSRNATEIKQAYRTLSKIHHPDKGGSEQLFARLHTAYRALTTDRDNYEQYGHPDGPLSTQSFAFALPDWLLQPQGTVAIVLILLYLAMFVAIVYFAIAVTKTDANKKQDGSASSLESQMSVAGADTAYLATLLSPESTHIDVLWAIATTPENIRLTQVALEKINELKEERQKKVATKTSSKSTTTNAFDLDSGDWDEDDEDDDAARKAKAEEEEKKLALEQLAQATGEATVLMEGLDEGVLGQAWVERTLAAKGHWPPSDLRHLTGKTFSGNKTALEDPAVRRNLCYTVGRINSLALNTHTELLEASSKQLIDQTYFKGSMEYRQRAGLLLEAALRIAVTMKSYRLAKTIVETVSMFKIGVQDPLSPKTLDWFKAIMAKQYSTAGLPGLRISDLKVETPDEEEIATNDTCAMTLTMERVHAEAFTKIKVAQCQKQGIPPQIALATYREGWWILVRAEPIGTAAVPAAEPALAKESPLAQLLQGTDTTKFDQEVGANRLLVAWPMIVQNMAQKSGKVKVQFKAPSVPGKYKIHMAIKSQEFLGTDQDFELPVTILDVEDVKRAQEEAEARGEDDDEAKKDK